jgi:hypothetical protein
MSVGHNYDKSFDIMFLGTWYIVFSLISAVNFYYIINKLIILIYDTY